MIDQQGPSAMPISARTSKSWWKLCVIPESQDKIEKAKTAGMRMGLRPIRSDKAPKTRVEMAQVTARTEANMPTCACVK
jgi:hypothetical protein